MSYMTLGDIGLTTAIIPSKKEELKAVPTARPSEGGVRRTTAASTARLSATIAAEINAVFACALPPTGAPSESADRPDRSSPAGRERAKEVRRKALVPVLEGLEEESKPAQERLAGWARIEPILGESANSALHALGALEAGQKALKKVGERGESFVDSIVAKSARGLLAIAIKF